MAGLEELLAAMSDGDDGESKTIDSLEAIKAALAVRVPLVGLKEGDVLRQVKRPGAEHVEYHTGKYVVFIKYLDGDIYRPTDGNRKEVEDILIATGVHLGDGTVLFYAVDSTAFVKATEEEIAQAMQE